MKIGIYPYGPIGATMYIVEGDRASYLIDPCVPLSEIEFPVVPLKGILITHCHYDHINRMEEIKNTTGMDVYAHQLEFASFGDPDRSGAMFFMSDETFQLPDIKVSQGDKFFLDEGSYLEAIHTPGHTSGSLSYLLNSMDKTTAVFSGDTLFKGSAGRTDLGGNPVMLDRSLRRLALLDPQTAVYPGHGQRTTIGTEQTENPFMIMAMRQQSHDTFSEIPPPTETL